MTTYTLTGLQVEFDDDTPLSAVPTVLTVVVEDPSATISYSNPFLSPGEDLPVVDIDTSNLLDFSIQGTVSLDAAALANSEAFFGFIEWSGGTTNVLAFYDDGTGFDHIFLVSGDMPTSFSDFSDFLAVAGSVTGGGIVDAPDPFAPDTPFTIDALAVTSTSQDDTWIGTNADEVVSLGNGADFMDGGTGNDKLNGGKGSDDIYGGGGKDVLRGENGKDDIFGGFGADKLIGGNGRDKLYGENNNDILDGGKGNDVMFGGLGADVFVFNANRDEGTDRIKDFEDGIDTINVKNAGFFELTITQSFSNVKVEYEGGVFFIEDMDVADITPEDFGFGGF